MSDTHGKDRRKFRRVNAKPRVSYRLKGDSEYLPVFSMDISAGGACLGLNRIIKKSGSVELQIVMEQERQTISCLGVIAWQDLRPIRGTDGKFYYKTGVRFEELDLKDRMKLIYYCHAADKNHSQNT